MYFTSLLNFQADQFKISYLTNNTKQYISIAIFQV